MSCFSKMGQKMNFLRCHSLNLNEETLRKTEATLFKYW